MVIEKNIYFFHSLFCVLKSKNPLDSSVRNWITDRVFSDCSLVVLLAIELDTSDEEKLLFCNQGNLCATEIHLNQSVFTDVVSKGYQAFVLATLPFSSELFELISCQYKIQHFTVIQFSVAIFCS